MLWQLSGVPEHDLVFIDTDLNRNAGCVILVNHCIEQGLAQGLQGEWITLHALNTFVADVCLEVFAVKQIQGLLNLNEQISVNFVLIAQFIIGDEKADLDVSAKHKALGLRAKQQRSSALQILPILKLQTGQQRCIAVLKHGVIYPTASGGPYPELLKCNRLAVGEREAR